MSAYRFHWLHTPGVVADAYVSSTLTLMPTPNQSNVSSLHHTLSSVLWNTIGTSSATLTPGAASALPHPTRLAMIWWLGFAPLLFYIGWQLYYFILVQVGGINITQPAITIAVAHGHTYRSKAELC